MKKRSYQVAGRIDIMWALVIYFSLPLEKKKILIREAHRLAYNNSPAMFPKTRGAANVATVVLLGAFLSTMYGQS
jgi:hypothetical protein